MQAIPNHFLAVYVLGNIFQNNLLRNIQGMS